MAVFAGRRARSALVLAVVVAAGLVLGCASDGVGERVGPPETVGLPDGTAEPEPEAPADGPSVDVPAPWEPGGDGSQLSPMCEAAKRIRAFDLQSESAFAAVESASSLEFAESAYAEGVAELSALLPEVTQAWDDLGASSPDLSADAVIVRDGTVDLTAIMVATPPLDLQNAIETQFGLARAQEVADATLRIDAVTRSACDIVLAD